jgi:hypothetical protein
MKFTNSESRILKRKVPSPSRKAWDEEASTKPHCIGALGFVEAARFLGGHLFAASTNQADAT